MTAADPLTGASWQVWDTEPGAWATPGDLPATAGMPSTVPGSAAADVRADSGSAAALARDYDGRDWWWRTRVVLHDLAGGALLSLPGVATFWTAFWDGSPVAGGRSMFRGASALVDSSDGAHDLVIVCRAIPWADLPTRPRAAWRSLLVRDQRLRWVRTSGLGRIPWAGSAPAVGPWRAPSLTAPAPLRVARVEVGLDGADGVVAVEVVRTDAIAGPPELVGELVSVALDLDGQRLAVEHVAPDQPGTRLIARIAAPPLWWPHTHGPATTLPLRVSVRSGGGDERVILDRSVGFRSVSVDRSDGGFGLRVNGVPIFARGTCWVPPDPLRPLADPVDRRAALEALVDAGGNMVRVTGTSTWQDDGFFADCDELGLLVWQDCMLHTLAPPDDEAWLTDLAVEVTENLAALQGHPSLAVVSGGSETEQQPTLWGLSGDRRRIRALEETIPAAVAAAGTGAVVVTSSPTGGTLPTSIRFGVSHYFGVGAYRRPLTDARLAGVRFAAESLAFANPPERGSTREWFGTATRRTDPDWRQGIAKDPTADWDFEQVLAHYAGSLFGADVERLRRTDPEHALDLLRATSAHVIEHTLAEWRRPGSTCAGAIILANGDLAPGAGWGITDLAGRPKSAWYAVRRACQPRAVSVTDEGLDGLAIHVHNDGPEALEGRMTVVVRARETGVDVLDVAAACHVDPHSARTLWLDDLLGDFRDVGNAWHFRDTAYDTVQVRVEDGTGTTQGGGTYLLGGPARPRTDVGLTATARRGRAGWEVVVRAERAATFVTLDAPGWVPAGGWFHLSAGEQTTVAMRPDRRTGPRNGPPAGTVRALNGHVEVSF